MTNTVMFNIPPMFLIIQIEMFGASLNTDAL